MCQHLRVGFTQSEHECFASVHGVHVHYNSARAELFDAQVHLYDAVEAVQHFRSKISSAHNAAVSGSSRRDEGES